jgi:hypothetical protein
MDQADVQTKNTLLLEYGPSMLMMTWMLSAFDPSDQQNHLPHF